MVDAAVDIAKVLFEKLLFCKEQFDDLQSLSDDLSDQLQQLIHLCEQRQREPKFAGAVQRHFTKRLKVLSDDLCAIMARRIDGGIGSKALLFIGSLWGGGAAADKKQLEVHSVAIDKLLTKLQIEAGTLTATATEELAGGAAAKFIRSEALQRFWRNQFKNELKLPWDGFKESLQQLNEMQLTFPHSLTSILAAMKGKMDRLGADNQIHVSEFSEFFGSSDTSNYQNITDMVRGHMTTNGRILLPAISFSTVDAVAIVAQMDDFIAVASSSGFVKLYSNAMPDCRAGGCGLSLVSQVTLPLSPDALCVALIESRVALLVGLPQIVQWYDAWSGSLVCTIPTQDHSRLIASSQGMLYVAALAASPRVQALRYDATSGSFDPVSVLSHHSSVRAVCPLGCNFALCCTASNGCTVWNVQLGSAVLHIPLQRLGSPRQILHDSSTNRFVLVGYQTRSIVSIVVEHLSIDTINDIDASYKLQQADIQELSSNQGIDNAALIDGQDDIHSFGSAALVVKDQLVKVYQYTVSEETGTIQVSRMVPCFLPTSLHKPKIVSLSSRPGFVAAGNLFGKQAPVWMVQEIERRNVPVLATPLNWLPMRPHFETETSWATSGHPAVSARSPTNQHLLISSCNSNCIQVSTLNAKTVILRPEMECMLSTKNSTMSSHISAIVLDGLDVIVATSGGWVMRYDFTSPPTALETSTSPELVEISAWVENWVDLEPRTSLQAQQRIMCLSEATVRLARHELSQAGLPHKLEQNLEELSLPDCQILYKAMVNLKAQLVVQCAAQQNVTPLASDDSCCDYRVAARWSHPVATKWIFDGHENCNICSQPLLPVQYIRQLCDGCVKVRGRCAYCNRRCDDHTLCDPCYNSRMASMRLRPMSMAVCGSTLVIGACVDDKVYGPTGGTLLTMNAKSLVVIDRLSKSWVPHFSNVAAYNMASCGIHIFAAPISYCTVGIFGAAADRPCGTLESMLTSYKQPQCCHTIAMDHGPSAGSVDIFSASFSRDLLWVQVQVDVNHTGVSVAGNRIVCHITDLLAAYTKLVVSDGLLFAGDRLFGNTVYRRGMRGLEPLLYCQSQTVRFDHALMFGRYFLTLGRDGAVGVLPVSYVEKMEVAAVLAGKASAIQHKRSLLVVPSTSAPLNACDSHVLRIDKHWSWRASSGGPNEPFISVNDVQKEEMLEALALSQRILVRRPESVETEELIVTTSTDSAQMLLLPSRREVVEVTDIASSVLSDAVKDPFLGTEHLVRLQQGNTMPFAFKGVVASDVDGGKRKWVLVRLLWCSPRCLVEVHSPSGAFETCTVEVIRKRAKEQHVWVCLGESAISLNADCSLPLVMSVVEGLLVVKRSPMVCENRCLPKSPALFVETSSRRQM